MDESRPILVSPFKQDGLYDNVSYKKHGFCQRKTLLIALLILTVVLALGLGLGLGLRNSSSDGPEPSETECKKFNEEVLTFRTQSTRGAKWLKKNLTKTDTPKCPPGFSRPPLLLISLDGFRAEYLDRKITPVMDKIRNNGIHAPYLRSTFPTKTFPNHYSIVTGLYPESHGIIDNVMYDTEIKEVFTLAGKESKDPRWWHGEPIWVTARKAGLKAGTMFWPGSEVKINGYYPDYCFQFEKSVPFEQRVDRVLTWLDLPESERPDLITLYFHEPDSAGHSQGPYGPWVTGNITLVDKMIGDLMDGLIDRGLENCMNIIVVSDHGMTPISCDRQVDISGPLAGEDLTIFDGVMARITSKYVLKDGEIVDNPGGVSADVIKSKLECRYYNTTQDYYSKVYHKTELPVRNHYVVSPRIEDVVMTLSDEWLVENGKLRGAACTGGSHGHDNIYTNMRAIFMAYGSSFNQMEVEAIENIELYNLMTDILGIDGVDNNGTYGRLHHLLRKPQAAPSPAPPGSEYKQPTYPGVEERKQRRAASDCNCSMTVDVEAADSKLDLTATEKESSVTSYLSTGRPVMMEAGLTVWELVQHNYITAYSTSHKMALWSAFSLNQQSGAASITANCTRVDVRLPTSDATLCQDYNGGNITASYLLPPGFIQDTGSESDAMISTNIVPMYSSFRDGIWRHVLRLMAEYSSKYSHVGAMLGPVFDDNHDGLSDDINNLNRFVPGSHVPLPTHYFVILTKCNDSSSTLADCPQRHLDTMAMLIPHSPDPGNCWDKEEGRPMEYLQTHVARVRDVEHITGLNFYQDIKPADLQLTLRTHMEVGLWERISWLDGDECDKMDTPQCPDGMSEPPLLVISLDGVRPEYLERDVTPVLNKLARCGTSTDYMLPIYPSLTFPNHYSLATGLYAESTGIVANSMYDQHMDLNFALSSPNKADPRWWGGEPIWNTVQRNNKTSGVMFWPGSDVKIGGSYPDRYFDYDGNFPYSKRVDTVLQWLTGSQGFKADFAMLYMEKVDKAGHTGGPNSYQVTSALALVDNYLKELMDGLKRHNMDRCVNIVVTSDHGMSDITCEKTVLLRDYTSLSHLYVYPGADGRVSNQYTYSKGYKPVAPKDRVPVHKFVADTSCQHNSLKVYERTTIPKRLHYAFNDRIENITLMLPEEWLVDRYKPWCGILGQHGWDAQTNTDLQAIFHAYGPAFKSEAKTEPFEAIELYNLFTTLLDISGAPNNGTMGVLNDILRVNPPLPTPDPGEGYDEGRYPATDEQYETRVNVTGCTCSTPEGTTLKDMDDRLNMTTAEKKDLLKFHMPHGLPSTSDPDVDLLYHEDYISAYSPHRGTPIWTAYKVKTKTGKLTSVNCLRGDVRLDLNDQPTCDDYGETSDYIHNQLFPSGLSSSQPGVYDTLLLTNTVPMMPRFASGLWRHLVSLVETWGSQSKGALYVVSGPVYDYNADGRRDDNIEKDKKFGSSKNISVPSHYFFILLDCPGAPCSDIKSYNVQAYVVEHRNNVTNCLSYEDYTFDHRARVRDVELLTGLEFFTTSHTVDAIRKRLRFPQTFGFPARGRA